MSLKPLLQASNDFCAGFDDAVCSLHPPQAGTDMDELHEAKDEMIRQARSLGISTEFISRWEEKRNEMEK